MTWIDWQASKTKMLKDILMVAVVIIAVYLIERPVTESDWVGAILMMAIWIVIFAFLEHLNERY